MKTPAVATKSRFISFASAALLFTCSLILPGGIAATADGFVNDDETQTKPAESQPASAQSAPADTTNAARGRGRRPQGQGQGRRPDRPAGNAAVVAIEHVRVIRPGKPDLEDASVLVRGRRIAAVGRKITIPDNAKRINGTNGTLTAGWIDARGTTPLEASAISEGTLNASFRAVDGLDWIDSTARVRSALERGVTSCYASPGIALTAGIGGLFKMRPGERDLEKLEVEDSSAASFVLGSVRGEPAVVRLTQLSNLRKTLRDALKYKEAVEQYEEDLKKFLEDKKKGLRPVLKPETEEKKEEADPRRDRPVTPTPRGRRPPRNAEELELLTIARILNIRPIVDGRDGEFLLDDKAPEPTEPVQDCGCGSPGPHELHSPPTDSTEAFFFQDAPKPDAKTTERPRKPDFNPSFGALIPVLKGEMRVRIEARRADEIKAAIAVAKEFRLNAVIEGADEAMFVIEDLVKAKLPVVIAPSLNLDQRNGLDADWAAAGILASKGIAVGLGSGREFRGTEWLRFRAAAAVAGGMTREAALAAVTSQAAEIIGVGDELGTIEPGKIADLVLFFGDPLDPSSVVKAVLLDGEVVVEQ